MDTINNQNLLWSICSGMMVAKWLKFDNGKNADPHMNLLDVKNVLMQHSMVSNFARFIVF